MSDSNHSLMKSTLFAVVGVFAVAIAISGFTLGIAVTSWGAVSYSSFPIDLWFTTWHTPRREWFAGLFVLSAGGASIKWFNEIVDAFGAVWRLLKQTLPPEADFGSSLRRIILDGTKAWLVCFSIPFTLVVSSHVGPQPDQPPDTPEEQTEDKPPARAPKTVVVFFKEELDAVMKSENRPFFEGLTFSAGDSAKQALELLASQLVYCNRGDHRSIVRLTGFASSSGPDVRNRDLANARVDTVADVFLKTASDFEDKEALDKSHPVILGRTSIITNRWQLFDEMAEARGFEDRVFDGAKRRYSKNRGQLNRRVEIEIEANGCQPVITKATM